MVLGYSWMGVEWMKELINELKNWKWRLVFIYDGSFFFRTIGIVIRVGWWIGFFRRLNYLLEDFSENLILVKGNWLLLKEFL